MGRKTDKPNKVGISTFNFDNFAMDCLLNEYVLVIGPEVVLNLNYDTEGNIKKANGNIEKLWLLESLEKFAERGVQYQNIKNFTTIGNNDLPLIVNECIEEWDFKDEFDKEFEPSLLELLSTRCFRLVLTTTFDPYLEIAMEKVWGKGRYRVLNFYGINKERDLRLDDQRLGNGQKLIDEFIPTLYYLFGKAEPNSNKKFVLTENDAMDTVSKWFGDKRPKQLLSYIQEKRIVSLGCKYDNWLYRFFWYILRGDVNGLSSKQVAVEYDSKNPQLQAFINRHHIQSYDDARKFMRESTDVITRGFGNTINARKTGGIFISYAHEDKYLALTLFNYLTDNNYKVWLDEKNLQGGDEYTQRISKAVNECNVFMPLLTSQVAYDLKHGNDRYYINTEWAVAQEKKSNQQKLKTDIPMKIIPVVTKGYDMRSDYHQKVSDCIKDVTIFDLYKEDLKELNKML